MMFLTTGLTRFFNNKLKPFFLPSCVCIFSGSICEKFEKIANVLW